MKWDALLEARNLSRHFAVRRGMFGARRLVRAVEGVSFQVEEGETLGLVGASGSGKTTVARLVLRLLPPAGGQVRFEGMDLAGLSGSRLRRLRPRLQAVFQDPHASLNPYLRVERIVGEALRAHGLAGRREARRSVGEALERVGLDAAAMDRRPHAFSTGQRQRIAIARALVLAPRLVVLDEPVSALDSSLRAQILNLLMDLREERGLAYLFIAHDLASVRAFCHRVAVMHQGRIVEEEATGELFSRPRHPATVALLAATRALQGALGALQEGGTGR